MIFFKKNLYKIISIIFVFVLVLPILSLAQTPVGDTGLVPCDGSVAHPCGFNQIFKLINEVIKFIFTYMAVPLAAIMFAYAGFELVTSSGETSKREKAKKIFTNVAIGLVLAAAAFLIVQTVLKIVGYDTGNGWDWFGF